MPLYRAAPAAVEFWHATGSPRMLRHDDAAAGRIPREARPGLPTVVAAGTPARRRAGLDLAAVPAAHRQPTLVLAGDDDPIIPLANARILAALIPSARLHVYHGGHLELVTRPDLLAPVVAGFLAQGSPRQASPCTDKPLTSPSRPSRCSAACSSRARMDIRVPPQCLVSGGSTFSMRALRFARLRPGGLRWPNLVTVRPPVTCDPARVLPTFGTNSHRGSSTTWADSGVGGNSWLIEASPVR